MIRCEDWRNAPPEMLEALYRLERARWLDRLHWDADPAHRILEDARRRGHAPGLVAFDENDRPVGWAYYVLHHRMLQIGGLVATSGEVTRALLDAVLHSPEADMASDLLCFAFASAPGLESALARQRFAVTRYPYLSRTLHPPHPPGGKPPSNSGEPTLAQITSPASSGTERTGHLSPTSCAAHRGDERLHRSGMSADAGGPSPAAAQPWRLRAGMRIAHWREADGVATVRLMARAYAGVRAARCFAPRGTLEEWATYVAQLVKMPACGQFLPSASLSATEPGQDAPRGVLIATSLAPDTAHIAQIVVDPSLRRRGLARDLIETTCALVADAGCSRITLLVSEDNAPALALYRAAGFETTSHFVYAVRQAPTRMRGVRPERQLVRPPVSTLAL